MSALGHERAHAPQKIVSFDHLVGAREHTLRHREAERLGQWLHEIKHDGFRVIARKDGPRVRLYSRPGHDFTRQFPLIVDALARLRSRSCIIDGEAVACDDNGVASLDLIRHHRANGSVFLYAFDLIELNGDDLRRDPLQVRKGSRQVTLDKKLPPPRGMVSAPSCELKTCTPVHRLAWLGLASEPFFGANCASRLFCSLRGSAYG
jgi:ATP dependent DNA ligase domain